MNTYHHTYYSNRHDFVFDILPSITIARIFEGWAFTFRWLFFELTIDTEEESNYSKHF